MRSTEILCVAGVRTEAPCGEMEVDETVGKEASGAFVSGLALTSGTGHV